MPTFPELLIGGVAPIVSATLEVSHQLATKSGSISSLTAHNYNASARMVLLIDSATAPTAGAVTPIWAFPIAALATTPGTVDEKWNSGTLQFKNGLWVGLSTVLTTPFTLTLAGANDGFFSAVIQTS